MIPYTDFVRLLTDVSECSDFDAYLAEVGGSVPLDDVDSVIRLLTIIWTMGQGGLSVKSISDACEISARQIAIQYHIPIRTVENWSAGMRIPPEWQLPLIAYAVLSDYMGG